ncbi:MAG: alpha-amylase family glycosyl hydrolase [Actinomycetota bacterium]
MRSFADSNGDGIGDIPGVTGRLDYLKWLGVDIVWLTPFYASPGHDHGYDVANYCEVNPIHGTLDDVDTLIQRAHQLGLRVVFDIVPNHTSSEHRWFKQALEDPSSPERDYYLFRDPAPGGGAPNNWPSHFGPTAWTLDKSSGQYYCHLFLPEQPDLNWRNPAVRAEFDAIYRFWFDRGVDGFRIDVAHGLLKHAGFPDLPLIKPVRDGAGPMENFFSFDHVFDLDQDDNVEIFSRWQDVAASYDACLLAESGVEDHDRLARYVQPGALDLTFFLKPGWMAWDPEKFVRELVGLAQVESRGVSWVISNHDQARPASRFGGGAAGRNRSLATTTLMFALGGVPFLYQGEELGSPNGEIAPEDRHDPISTRNSTDEGRDVCRTPMAWNTDPYNGFSTVPPWITSEDRALDFTVAGQHANSAAPLHRYRRLIALRKHHPDLWRAEMKIVESGRPDVAIVQRGATLTVANLGPEAFAVNLGEGQWRVVFASQGGDGDTASGIVNVSGETTVVLVPA